MDQKHRDIIQKNYISLVEQTDLELMVTALYEKEVFSEAMIEPYKDTTKDVRMRKRMLYLDVMRRGPQAFQNLLDALQENGYWELVRMLDPNSIVNPMPRLLTRGNDFLSLSKTKREELQNKERKDHNRNSAGPSTRPSNSSRSTREEENGNVAEALTQLALAERNNEIPKFNVIKSTKFFEESEIDDIKLYSTRGRQRGVLVMFSYQQYDQNIEPPRPGADVDVTNLRYLFKELGFKVIVYTDLKATQTRATLGKLQDVFSGSGFRDRPDTMFIMFSSHGYMRAGTSDNEIRCSCGGLISLHEVIEYFNNERFPALKGVPKVFVFQNCRGDKDEYTLRAPPHLPEPQRDGGGRGRGRGRAAADGAHPTGDAEDAPDAVGDNRDRIYSDILIAHSTVPGSVSRRDPVAGSWYIQVLCQVFAERAHDRHVADLFTLVDKRLQERYSTQTSSVDRWGFNKRLYLHPGLYE